MHVRFQNNKFRGGKPSADSSSIKTIYCLKRNLALTFNFLVSTNQVMNSPAFPWTASPVFHFRFYQRTSTLLWSGDTVCRRMNHPPYSGETHTRGEGYRGTLRDEIGIRSSFYLFNKWTKKWTLTRISYRWPYFTDHKRRSYLHPTFQKGRCPSKCNYSPT